MPTPRQLPGLALAIGYINIDLRDKIVSSSAEDVLRGCYDSTRYPANYYCSLVTREITPGDNFRQVLTLDEPYINQGGLRFQAIKVEASAWPAPAGFQSGAPVRESSKDGFAARMRRRYAHHPQLQELAGAVNQMLGASW